MSKCETPLHGLTVVVDTAGPRLYIGRFDVEDDRGVLLRDVDVRDLPEDVSKDEYIARTAKFGVFKNTDHVRVPSDEIVSIRRLSEFEPAP